jgi:hypothetical protein
MGDMGLMRPMGLNLRFEIWDLKMVKIPKKYTVQGYMSPVEIAAFLSVKPDTVRKWIAGVNKPGKKARGIKQAEGKGQEAKAKSSERVSKLPAVKIGKAVRVSCEDFKRWFEINVKRA